jgi:hypothetical protein
MDKNDLKSMWHDAHYTKNESTFPKDFLQATIALKHSKAISKSLLDIKLKVILYALILLIYAGLMIYALVFLKLSLSVNSLVPLTLAGIFLMTTASSEIVRLLVMTKTADNLSIKDSSLVFCRKLKRIKTTDFVIFVIFFYLSAILLIFSYLTDIGSISNLSWSSGIVPAPLIGILILMLLSIPWFIKYQNNRRYKKLLSDLNETVHQLRDLPDGSGC